MPTYDYKCLDCNYTFEEFQKITDSALEVCPSCKGNLKRLIGAGAGPIFKGSGFYQTDYKNSSKKADTDSKSDTIKKEAITSTKKEVKASKKD